MSQPTLEDTLGLHSDVRPLRVAQVGYAFMGAAHSQAWRTAHRAFDLPLHPVMSVLCGRTESATRAAALKLGWADWSTSWQDVVTRDDVDVVDICTPGESHAEIAIAALEAGKHVLCEKPLANTVGEARAMASTAQQAAARGVRSMVGFNYRRLPAIALARQMIADGLLGDIRHVRAKYQQDWIVDPEFPLVWRLQRDLAGSGALGDLGAHVIDLVQHLTGEPLIGLSATLETFIKERPLPETSSGLAASGGTSADRGPVTVDDAAVFFGRTRRGALATFEVTRFAIGRKNGMGVEVYGSTGGLVFELESMNELHFYDGAQPASQAGFRRILVTEPDHPYLSAWWPPGHLLGYEHTFTHEVADFVADIDAGRDPSPSFTEGLQVQRVLDAVEASAADGSRWTAITSD